MASSDTERDPALRAPPRNGEEWLERAAAAEACVPGLGNHLGCAPVGWFPLLERAALELRDSLPPGASVRVLQVKEKFGTLRWYARLLGQDERTYEQERELLEPIARVQRESESTCAVLGTRDATLDTGQPWLLTLSPAASETRRKDPDAFRAALYPDWALWKVPSPGRG